MRRAIVLPIALALCVGAIVLGVVSRMEAQVGCTLASVSGKFGISQAGFSQVTDPATGTVSNVPFAAVGRVTADGAGRVSGEFTASSNGTIATFADAGTYTVNPNCTGTVTFASGRTAYFVVISAGDEVQMISTTPGTIHSGVAVRQ
jgi:hypothetical protein